MPSPLKSTPARRSPTDTDPDALATRLVPDLTPDQELQLAAAKKAINMIVSLLRTAHTAARELMFALRPVEPEFYDSMPSPAVLKKLGPGICLDVNGPIFTNPAHDLGTEIFWSVDTEDQLEKMIESLEPLVTRDEHQEVVRRRNALAEYLRLPIASTPKV